MATLFDHLCLAWFIMSVASAAVVAVMFYLRRNIYPITAVPIIWPLLTHLGVPLSVYSYLFKFVHKFLGDSCHGPNAIFLSSLGYFPAVPAFEVQLVHIWYVYNLQTEQIKATTAAAAGSRKQSSDDKNGEGGLTALISTAAQKKRNGLFYTWGMYAVMFIYTIPCPVTTAIDYYANNMDEKTCQGKSNGAVYSQILIPLFGCTLILYTAYLIRHVEEEFKLKQQFKLLTSMVVFLGLPFRMVNIFIDVEVVEDLERVLFACIYFGYTVICGFYPLYLTFREESRQQAARKSSRKVGSSQSVGACLLSIKNVSQLRILIGDARNDAIVSQFRAYLVKEFCCENILFALAALRFRQATSRADMLKVAKEIGDTYLLPAASVEINISASLKTEIQSKLRNMRHDDMEKDFFEKVEMQVYQMLLHPFNRFLLRERIAREAVALDAVEAVVGGGDAQDRTVVKDAPKRGSNNSPSIPETPAGASVKQVMPM